MTFNFTKQKHISGSNNFFFVHFFSEIKKIIDDKQGFLELKIWF